MEPGSPRAPAAARRRLQLLAVALAVLAAHLLIGVQLERGLRSERAPRDGPQRLQVAFVRELQLSEPPVLAATAPQAPAAAPPRPARVPRGAAPGAPRAAAEAASSVPPALSAAQIAAERAALRERARAAVAAALAAEAASAPPQAVLSEAAPDAPAYAALGGLPASAPAQPVAAAMPGEAAAAALDAAAFEWPPSTRLSYQLVGFVRGIVEGSARVDWLREGERYQVHLDVLVGPSFAPIVQRRMSSDGTITAEGLTPRRYDEQTDVAFARSRAVSMAFDDAGVTLGDGRRAERLPGVQDTASQFVQMTYLFRSGARRLVAGGQIELPLALPKRVDRWIYDVVGEETLATPFGPVPAWHLKPRRIGDPSTLAVEAWFAPRLDYLPVRLLIRQSDENFIDLVIDRLPQQAAAPAAGAAASR